MIDPRRVDIFGHIALILLVVAFAALTSMHIVRPFLASRQNISGFREAVTLLSKADGSLDRLDSELKRLESEIAASEAALPTEINLDAFLDQVGDIAAHEGVCVEHLVPSQIRQHKLFRELVIEVHVKGPFLSVTDFMAKLEHGDRISKINHLTITPDRETRDCVAKMSLALYFGPNART